MKQNNAEDQRVEFKKLIEMCAAFKEDIDYHEMQDVSMDDPNDPATKLRFQLKTSEDKVQQMLYDEYRQNRHSMLFDQMQEMILGSRNGNLIGGLLMMKIKQHDLQDIENIVYKCIKSRAGREMIEEIGKHNPRVLRLTEKVVANSQNFKMISYACYIDGININKMAHAVIKLNNLEQLQEFGEQHAEDLSMRTRRMVNHHYKSMEAGINMEQDSIMERYRHK